MRIRHASKMDYLKELLDLSSAGEEHIAQGRLADALAVMRRREAIAAEIATNGEAVEDGDGEAARLIGRINENDAKVKLLVSERLDAVARELKGMASARPAISAYKRGGAE